LLPPLVFPYIYQWLSFASNTEVARVPLTLPLRTKTSFFFLLKRFWEARHIFLMGRYALRHCLAIPPFAIQSRMNVCNFRPRQASPPLPSLPPLDTPWQDLVFTPFFLLLPFLFLPFLFFCSSRCCFVFRPSFYPISALYLAFFFADHPFSSLNIPLLSGAICFSSKCFSPLNEDPWRVTLNRHLLSRR